MSSENLTGKAIEQKTLPGSRRQVKVPTVQESSITPQNNFTTPYIAGETAMAGIAAITNYANKAADTITLEEGKARGYAQQQAEIEQGNADYVGGGTAFSIADRAYQAGANVAYTVKKSAEFEDQLKELAEKRMSDPNRFTKDAQELRKKLLEGAPTNLLPDLGMAFDKTKTNLDVQIGAKIRLDTFEQNKLTVQDGIYRELGKITGSIKAGGMSGAGITDSMEKINVYLASLKQQYGLTPKQLRETTDAVRQQLFGQLLKYEFDSLKNDPAGRTKLKADIMAGNYTFGEFGETFGNLIPGGKDVTLRESSAYSTIFDSYEKLYIQGLATEKIDHKANETNRDIDYKMGRGYSITADGTVVPPANTEYDFVNGNFVGLTPEQIAQGKFDREVSLTAGQLVFKATVSDWGTINNVYNDIDDLNRMARVTQNPAKRGLYSEAAKIAKQEVDKVIKAREQARANGTEADFFTEQLGPLFFTDGINLEDDVGTQRWIDAYETKYANLPVNFAGLPSIQGVKELNSLRQAQTVDELRSNATTFLGRQKQFAQMWIASGIKGLKAEEKDGAYAYLQYVHLLGANKMAEADQLAAAIFQRKPNIETLKNLSGAATTETYATNLKEAKQTFIDTYGKSIDQRTSYGKAQLETFENIYLKIRGNNPSADPKEATAIAMAFIKDTNAKITLSNGQDVYLPASMMQNTGTGANNQGIIEDELNNIIRNPHMYNIQPAQGQTYDDIIDDIDNYTFMFDNGHFVLKNSKGDMAASVFMKLPSDANSLYFSDALFTPSRERVSRSAFTDKEGTWTTTSNFSKELPTTYSKSFPADAPSTLMRTTGIQDRMADNYGVDVQKTFVKNYMTRNETTGQWSYKYYDWMVPNLVGLSEVKQQTALGISLKLKENKFENIDAIWLARNVDYLSSLNNPTVRAAIIKEYRSNFESNKTLQTKNTGATVMSPLQVLATITRNYQYQADQSFEETREIAP